MTKPKLVTSFPLCTSEIKLMSIAFVSLTCELKMRNAKELRDEMKVKHFYLFIYFSRNSELMVSLSLYRTLYPIRLCLTQIPDRDLACSLASNTNSG